jgi:hypothetical protein
MATIRRFPKPPIAPARPPATAVSAPVKRVLIKPTPPAPRLVVGQRVWHGVHGKARITRIDGERATVQPEAEGSPRTVPLAELISWKVHAKQSVTAPAPKKSRILPAQPVRPSRPAATTARALSPADPGTWYPVTRTLVVLAREKGLRVDPKPGGFAIRSTRPPFRELVRIREDATGAHSARAAASAGTSVTDEGRLVVTAVNREIARHLQRGLDLQARLALVAYLRKAEVHLEQAARTTRTPKGAPSEPKGPVSDGLGRWERKTWPGMIRFVQGGSPGSGRRS